MPCWKSPFEFGWLIRWFSLFLTSVGLLLPVAQAQGTVTPLQERQVVLERDADGLHLNARLAFEPGDHLEDALHKGIPIHFVWRVDVVRPRWYWKDEVVSTAIRTVRLAYQPLTRRWRVSHLTGAPSALGLQNALYQNFDSLKEAMASVGRVSQWHIADAAQIKGQAQGYRVDFSFRLDFSSLPRPFQIGAANHGDWNIVVEEKLRLPEVSGMTDPARAESERRVDRTEGQAPQ